MSISPLRFELVERIEDLEAEVIELRHAAGVANQTIAALKSWEVSICAEVGPEPARFNISSHNVVSAAYADHYRHLAAHLAAKLVEALAALKPLVILLPSIDPDRPNDRVLYKVNDAAITYGDVRRAAALMQSAINPEFQPLDAYGCPSPKLEKQTCIMCNGTGQMGPGFCGHCGGSGTWPKPGEPT